MRHLLVAVVVLAYVPVAGWAELGWVTLDYPGAESTNAFGIDGDIIVGSYEDSSGSQHGFIRDGSSWETLDFLGRETVVRGIDGDNMVGYYMDAIGDEHGLVIDGDHRTQRDIQGAQHTWLTDVDDGIMVGSYRGFENGGFICWGEFGREWEEFDFPGARLTEPRGIDGEKIVGYYSCSRPRPGEDGCASSSFLYDGTNWITLEFPGEAYTYAYGIDGDNIVGNYRDSSGYYHGFLYDGASWSALDLPGGAEYIRPYDIDGDKIVGYYVDTSGDEHGFVYTIPEPGMVLLVGFGGLGVLRRRRLVKS